MVEAVNCFTGSKLQLAIVGALSFVATIAAIIASKVAIVGGTAVVAGAINAVACATGTDRHCLGSPSSPHRCSRGLSKH